MRDPIILLVHLIATLARLMGPGGLRSVVAESLLVKHQLLILNRSRHRAPNLRVSDRILAGVCALFMRPARVFHSAIAYGAKKRPRLGRCWSSLPSSLRLCRLRCSSSSSRSLAG